MSDPKLKTAMDEIKAVLEKHDVGGLVILSSEDFMEHYTHLNTTWSCAKYDGEMVRFRAAEEEFPSKEAQKKCMENTVGVIAGFSDVCRSLKEEFDSLLQHLSEKFEIRHRTKRL